MRRSTEELRAKERVSVGQGSGTTSPAGAAVVVATGSPSAPSSPSGCASPAQAHPGPTLRPRCSGSHLRRCSEELRGGGERSSLPRPCSGPRARPAPGNSPRRVPTAGAPGTLCKAHSPLLRSQPLPSRVPLMAREPARSLTHLAACCGVHDDSTFISTRLQGRRTVSHAKGKCCCECWGRRKEAEEGSQPRV